MKKFVRVFLLLDCFVLFLIFVKDLEALSGSNSLFAQIHTPEEWRWLWISEGIPLASMIVASVYSFMHSRKNGYILAIAAALYTVFLLISQPLRVHPNYVSAPPALTAVAAAVYLACVFLKKIPYRRKIALGTMAVLAVTLTVMYCFVGDFSVAMDWILMYIPPLAAFGMLGHILPEA